MHEGDRPRVEKLEAEVADLKIQSPSEVLGRIEVLEAEVLELKKIVATLLGVN